ncbi:MAG: hypothetical protein WBQ44_15125, partial [Rhodococcus sp. (in: high G+C Gram-positive bacteria)]
AGLRAGIRQEVRELLAHTETPALLVTHDRAEAMTTADRVMVLLGGRDAQTGTPEDLYRRPVSAELGSFVGEAHVVDAVRNGGRAETVLGSVDVAEGSSGRGSVLVRPEQLQPVADPEGRFRVFATYFAGPHIQVAVQHIDTGMSMTAWVRELDSLGAGATVRLHVRGRVPFFAIDSMNGHAVRRCASAATAAS